MRKNDSLFPDRKLQTRALRAGALWALDAFFCELCKICKDNADFARIYCGLLILCYNGQSENKRRKEIFKNG